MYKITVSIVYASTEKQWLKELRVMRGTSAKELIDQSGFLTQITDLHDCVVDELNIGIYAQKVDIEHLMEEGDRLEIYRDLTADPKEVRRKLALMGKSMGKK
ncbi:MAG: putative ubiquitin-RnfH superfamily antitoxin RatB of RatAB toxin-antitoxin module [Dinoroseobacter sp.]|jgi:putative ubiquitin-RnfH superfamily antitoxin RatB of RatAB toxin-antitoxin module